MAFCEVHICIKNIYCSDYSGKILKILNTVGDWVIELLNKFQKLYVMYIQQLYAIECYVMIKKDESKIYTDICQTKKQSVHL